MQNQDSVAISAAALAVGALLGWLACSKQDVSGKREENGEDSNVVFSAPLPLSPCPPRPAHHPPPTPLFPHHPQKIKSSYDTAVSKVKSVVKK
jgi:hypothetical protein